jgi:hypothetical protein
VVPIQSQLIRIIAHMRATPKLPSVRQRLGPSMLLSNFWWFDSSLLPEREAGHPCYCIVLQYMLWRTLSVLPYFLPGVPSMFFVFVIRQKYQAKGRHLKQHFLPSSV